VHDRTTKHAQQTLSLSAGDYRATIPIINFALLTTVSLNKIQTGEDNKGDKLTKGDNLVIKANTKEDNLVIKANTKEDENIRGAGKPTSKAVAVCLLDGVNATAVVAIQLAGEA